MSDLVTVGKVLRPHGLRGLLWVRAYSGPEASFTDVTSAFLKTESGRVEPVSVTSIHAHKNGFLMDVAGIRSADEAEEYRGAEILVRKSALTREEGAYFWYELKGLDVYLETGILLGTVTDIISTGANDIYVVEKGSKEVLIPATMEVIREIDLESKKMIISPLEGLLELNEV